MSGLPSYQPRKLPEGRYTFKIDKEPERRRHQGEQGEFISITFSFKAQSPNGDVRNHMESILPWEDRYRDILLALGGEEDEAGNVHLSDMFDIVGKKFDARIKHEPDRNDKSKSWARITDIEVKGKQEEEDVPPPVNESEDDPEVPF